VNAKERTGWSGIELVAQKDEVGLFTVDDGIDACIENIAGSKGELYMSQFAPVNDIHYRCDLRCSEFIRRLENGPIRFISTTCIKNWADALANLPSRARWIPKGDAAVRQ
jgi:hypothetical protein